MENNATDQLDELDVENTTDCLPEVKLEGMPVSEIITVVMTTILGITGNYNFIINFQNYSSVNIPYLKFVNCIGDKFYVSLLHTSVCFYVIGIKEQRSTKRIFYVKVY